MICISSIAGRSNKAILQEDGSLFLYSYNYVRLGMNYPIVHIH
jgi:hypothetical protein